MCDKEQTKYWKKKIIVDWLRDILMVVNIVVLVVVLLLP